MRSAYNFHYGHVHRSCGAIRFKRIRSIARGALPHSATRNREKEMEEKLIESLIYTLTDIDGINEIMIFVDGTKLEELPQSKIKLPNTLDRSFGINKVYDLTSLKDVSKTIVYYIGEFDDLVYYVPVTTVNNEKNNKVEIIIDELKSSPIYETNLMSYLASSVELESYEELENQITLSFNNAIFDDFNEENILEGRIFRYHEGKIQCVFKFREP